MIDIEPFVRYPNSDTALQYVGTPDTGNHGNGSGWPQQEFTHATANKADALMVALCGTLVLSALVVTPGLFFFYDVTPKIVVLLLGCSVAVALAGRWVPGLRRLNSCTVGRMFVACLALQTVSVVFSTMFSVDPNLSVTGSNWRRLGLVVELVLVAWTAVLAGFAAADGRRVLTLLRAMCLAGLVGALYGISQYFGFDPLLPAGQYHVGEGEWTIVRTPGSLGHAGYFAVFLLHGAFAGAALAVLDSERTWRAVGAVTTALAPARRCR